MKKNNKRRKRVPYGLRNKLSYDRAACKRLDVMRLGMCNKCFGGDPFWDEYCFYRDGWKEHYRYMENFLGKHLCEPTDKVKVLLKSKLPLKNKDVFERMWNEFVTKYVSDKTAKFIDEYYWSNYNYIEKFVDYDGVLLSRKEFGFIIVNSYNIRCEFEDTANELIASDKFRKYLLENGIDTSLPEELLKNNNENML